MSQLIWANWWCSGSWRSPPHAWLATVNWCFMQAAGPCASSIRPAAGIVPVYCINIYETATFTAVLSKLLIVYATKIHMCKFWGEIRNGCYTFKLKGHEINMIYKENCLFSPRALVKGIPASVDFTPENRHTHRYGLGCIYTDPSPLLHPLFQVLQHFINSVYSLHWAESMSVSFICVRVHYFNSP